MKKPKNQRGIGVRFTEIESACSGPMACRDSQYLALLLAAAVEKLRCLRELSPETRRIVDRAEWHRGDKW